MLSQSFLTASLIGFFVLAHGDVMAQNAANALRWEDDPVCQTVFFGVLEGLYRDRVSMDVVNKVIGEHVDQQSKDALRSRMKKSFVLDCPLCEPTFHAFLAYQGHLHTVGEFQLGDKKTGLEEGVVQLMLGDANQPRLEALAGVVQSWVEDKFRASNLAEEELVEWKSRIRERVLEGKGELAKLMQSDENYQNCAIYWGCAACNGVDHAANVLGNASR